MTNTECLQAGQQAISAGEYAKAIELLEACCQKTEARSLEYIKAQMALVKAHYQAGNIETAIALCQELAQNPNPKIQAWANNALENLPTPTNQETFPPQNLLIPEEAQAILQQGNKALKYRRYDEAVQLLEKFYQNTDPSYRDHYQAQTFLVKAYQNNQQLDLAIELCQKLTTIEHEVTQIWARNYLLTLAPEVAQAALGLQPENQATEAERKSTTARLPKRSIEDFKEFARQNLLSDLRNLEQTRNQILTPLAIASIIFIAVLGLIIKFAPLALENTIISTKQQCETPAITSVSKGEPSRLQSNFEKRIEKIWEQETRKQCRSSFVTKSTRDGLNLLSLFLLGVFVSTYLWVAFYTSSTETYGREFARNVIEKIVSFLDPQQNLIYSRIGNNQSILSAFQQSKLFAETGSSTYIKQDHCVSGRIGQTHIFFSELLVQRELPHTWISSSVEVLTQWARFTGVLYSIAIVAFFLLSIVRGAPYCISRIVKGQRIDFEHFRTEIILNSVSRKSIFKGIFFVSDFNKKFRGRTIITPNSISSKLKILNQHRGQPVKLEDPEFNKLFSVYSNDQIGARYVLSTSVMQRIVEFRKKANRDLFIALVDSQLYIAVPSEEDLFEPKLFKTMLNFNPVREYFEVLQIMLSIVEDLNLNQRIWNSSSLN